MAPWLEMILTSLPCSVGLYSRPVQTFISGALCPQLSLSHKLYAVLGLGALTYLLCISFIYSAYATYYDFAPS